MVNRKIQMKNWNGATWDNLFPYTVTENVFDRNGVDLETNLSNVISDFNNKIQSLRVEEDLIGLSIIERGV
jgi:hypothetical protein